MADTVLLAVDAATSSVTADDRVLREALERRGAHVRPLVWTDVVAPPPAATEAASGTASGGASGGASDEVAEASAPSPAPDSTVPDGATIVIRSTWDHVDHPERFAAWLDVLDAAGATVHNPTALLRWNVHKGHLVDLAERLDGAEVAVVPTRVVPAGSELTLAAAAEGWDDVVVKPAIGATARLTVHAGREGRDEADAHLRQIVASEDAVVQRYLPEITTAGEISVVAIAGQPTHAVHKRAAPGDWRVQSDFGGTTTRVTLQPEYADVTREVLDVLDTVPSYARVDLVHDRDDLVLLELELVEPELFFLHAPEAAYALAAHVLGVE